MQIAVETYGRIAFAYGIKCKSPPRAGRGGFVMRCTVTPGRAVIGSRGRVGRRAFQFAQMTS